MRDIEFSIDPPGNGGLTGFQSRANEPSPDLDCIGQGATKWFQEIFASGAPTQCSARPT